MRGRIGVDRVGKRAYLVLHVLAQPRHGGELHPVGHLVQAHPQPEVGRVDLELALDADQVRRDEQQLAAGTVEELELPEHLAGQEAEDETDLHAGQPAADAFAIRPTGFSAASLSTSGVSSVRMPPAFASIQAARSMTRVAAVTGGSSSWVSSATWSAARAAAWYSSETVSSACARLTDGGGRAEPLRGTRSHVPVDQRAH